MKTCPGFTVLLEDGNAFDANHLQYAWMNRAGWVVTFVCSGAVRTATPDQIKEIKFHKEGLSYCGDCDGPIPDRG